MNFHRWTLGVTVVLLHAAIAGRAQEPTSLPEPATSDECVSPTEGDDFDTRILWKNTRYREALFIPEALLMNSKVADLPLDERNRDLLELKLKLKRDPPDHYFPNPRFGPDDECRERRDPGSTDPWPTAKGLVESFRGAPLVMTAKVLRVVDGWVTWHSGVGRVAWLKPETVIHNEESDLPAHVAILLRSMGGEIVVSNTKICTVRVLNDLVQPAAGDLILLAGTRRTFPDEAFVNLFLEFPLVDGMVQPQPYRDIREREPVSLREIQELFEAGECATGEISK